GLSLVALSDTGASDRDGITNDRTPTIRADAEAGTLVRFYIDGHLGGTVQAKSTVEWTSDPLSDGRHVFTATAENAAGKVSAFSTPLEVTIDTIPPIITGFDLEASSDTAPVGDGETTAANVNLVGRTEPGVHLTLEDTARTIVADNAGLFSF